MPKMHALYREYGQSMWLDDIDRDMLLDGRLTRLVEDGLRGVTSNPTIFHKAISTSAEYDDVIHDLVEATPTLDDQTLCLQLTTQDVQMAADILAPVYISSEGADGFVSLEVSPHLAYDTEATIEAARHLWQTVNRPNLMIKVPGTLPGLPAIERLIAEGINVNVTLLFSVSRYQAVADAYLRGLAQNPEPSHVVSVASFFVSRVDTKVDAALDEIDTPMARALKGKIAVANAKMAYQHFKSIVSSEQFAVEKRRGARPQRPLWASTSTKNPEYSEVLYVESLIGTDTVNTVTPETLDAFRSWGRLNATLESDIEGARHQLDALAALGVNLEQVTEVLEQEGVNKFVDSYDQLLNALKVKRFATATEYAGA